ncbi:hypothetical protein Lal_00022111 [Lupinus albus]|nr:hypothetical protein Lal_00022111 [Lupinus albus]
MGPTNPFDSDATSIKCSSIFNGEGYTNWKVRMGIFMKVIDINIWDVIQYGTYIPLYLAEREIKEKRRSLLTNEEKIKVQLDLKAKNIITYALSYNVFFNVSQCISVKEM